ncbi:MAG: protein kinase, partial [Myxococcales bacterium]|nr:protein kinase [Myxococcales bacterium]
MPKAPRGLSDRYELLVELGRGASSARYVGRALGAAGARALVFVRLISPAIVGDARARELFLRDARAAERLRHSNVNPPLAVEAGSDRLVVVSEHLEGGTLREAGGARLSATAALRVVLDACAGLHALHELQGDDGQPLGLVHGDVSPGSIFLGTDGLTRVTRVGLGRAAATGPRAVAERAAGRLGYGAPERLHDEGSDRRADVFSLAAVAWELFAGEPLFGGASDDATVAAVLQRTPRALGLPGGLDDVLARALAKAPEQRFATAEELADALHFAAVRAKLAPTHREVAAAARAAFGARLETIRSRISKGPEHGLRSFEALPPPPLPPAAPRKVSTEPPPTRRVDPGRLPAEATPSTRPPAAPTHAAKPTPPAPSTVEVDDDDWGDPTPSVPTLTTKPPPKEIASVAPPAPPPPAPLPKATLRMGAVAPKTKTTPMMAAVGFPAPTPRAEATAKVEGAGAPVATPAAEAHPANEPTKPPASAPPPSGGGGAAIAAEAPAEAAAAGATDTGAATTDDTESAHDNTERDSSPPSERSTSEPKGQRPSLPPSPWARRAGAASASDDDARASVTSDAPAPAASPSLLRSPLALALLALVLALAAVAFVRVVALPPTPPSAPPPPGARD